MSIHRNLLKGLSLKAPSLSCSVPTMLLPKNKPHPTHWCETRMPGQPCWIALAYLADRGHKQGLSSQRLHGAGKHFCPYSGSQSLVRNFMCPKSCCSAAAGASRWQCYGLWPASYIPSGAFMFSLIADEQKAQTPADPFSSMEDNNCCSTPACPWSFSSQFHWEHTSVKVLPHWEWFWI